MVSNIIYIYIAKAVIHGLVRRLWVKVKKFENMMDDKTEYQALAIYIFWSLDIWCDNLRV